MSDRRVAELMAHGASMGLERLDVQLIVGHALGRSRGWLLAHDDALLSAEQLAMIEDGFVRRAAGEPFAYFAREKEFHGLRLAVSPAVLVPRPDTETLVEWALEVLTAPDAPALPRVVDLGTGSGAIALAIRHGWPPAAVTAVDCSAEALAVARLNAEALGLDVRCVRGDWWEPLAGSRFDLVVSNPPYIAADDPHLAALRHEPTLALTPGGDGLDAIRRIVSGAAAHLTAGGWLLLEHGHDQADAVAGLLRQHGFVDIAHRHDLAGIARCTGGRCTGASSAAA